jgi:pyruvate formate lyase activating enzyme
MSNEVLTLEDILMQNSREGELYAKLDGNRVQCFACGHRCRIPDGRPGVCKVRFNRGGKLYVPWGYVSGLALDPIEKKPFFHVYPGSLTLSFGMLGCDYHCSYCQNWVTSQALRDPVAGAMPEFITPEEIVRTALKYNSKIITTTYNEPLITSEWAVGIFKIAEKYGIRGAYVSNGNGTPEVLDYIRPYVDFYKVDLKTFQDRHYRKLGGRLSTVLDTIRMLVEKGFWVEIVTLVVPGFNDSEGELRDIAGFIASISPDIPWHVTAFHKDYKMTDPDNTTPGQLIRAAEIGYEAGLRFVYAGNIPGHVGRYENTYCYNCNELLVERFGFKVMKYRLMDGSCPKCNSRIPGYWN